MADPATGGLRGYCDQHQMAAVLDGLDQITQYFGDVVERLDTIERLIAEREAET